MARDLTSSTLWLIGHRWGPESDGKPAAPLKFPVPLPPPPPGSQTWGKKGLVRLDWRLNPGFPFSPQALHCLTNYEGWG